MSANYNMLKMFECCRKYQHSICLKLWIMIFVCSLLCFTCLVIENRRNEIVRSRSIKSKQDAQKLIQIRSSFNNDITKNDIIEESSGYYADDVAVNPERIEQYPIEANEPISDSREMLAASNCVSKSSDLLSKTQTSTEHDIHDYICKELAEHVEQLLEYPEFSETQANNMFLDYEAEFPERQHKTNEYEWVDNSVEENDFFQLQPEEDIEPIYHLSDTEYDTPVTWDMEDRFFPDEYAFQTKSSEDIFVAEPHNIIQSTNDIPIEKMSPSDIPSMIDTFLGKISTLFVPPMPVKNPNLKHLNNFKDIPFNVEGMRLAASKINPVWHLDSSGTQAVRRQSIQPETNLKTKIFGKRRRNGTLLPKLLRILREK